eukprot:TRINITY_DN54_c0_g2_i2.p1 TRINITY_DN54_c0_g2~~TRINITY_DN54_c0_g2_i2.p1  ORF type:complete len:108 (+),score=12.01 TRINITY_DN54_c0_g2_i2:146-469(+)
MNIIFSRVVEVKGDDGGNDGFTIFPWKPSKPKTLIPQTCLGANVNNFQTNRILKKFFLKTKKKEKVFNLHSIRHEKFGKNASFTQACKSVQRCLVRSKRILLQGLRP